MIKIKIFKYNNFTVPDGAILQPLRNNGSNICPVPFVNGWLKIKSYCDLTYKATT